MVDLQSEEGSRVEGRWSRIAARMEQEGLPALLTWTAENRRYLTGFTGSAGYVLFTPQETVLLVDGRYTVQARTEARGATVVDFGTGPGWLAGLCEQVKRLGLTKIGFEDDAVSVKSYSVLREALPDVSWAPASRLVEGVRHIKEATEIAVMREAARLADDAFAHVLDLIRPGAIERDIALALEVFMKTRGADGTAFDTIVASGERSALPHGRASGREIGAGEFVTLDFGCYLDGYASDLTRTVFVGRPTDRHREIYDTVLRAQGTALAGLAPGLTGAQADALARDVITAAGYADAFSHSTGHGLGLEVHEHIRLASGSDDVLQEGMAVTVEPGVYLGGFGGVRIEDDAVITAIGSDRLTWSPKEFITL